VKNILPAIDRALMFLHEQKIITLQGRFPCRIRATQWELPVLEAVYASPSGRKGSFSIGGPGDPP
jgi:hypothetical protein